MWQPILYERRSGYTIAVLRATELERVGLGRVFNLPVAPDD